MNQEDIKGKYSLYLVFKYEIFEFEVLFEPFLFFQYDEIQDFVNKQNINSAKIAGGDIFYKNFDKEYQEKEYISLYNEKVVKNEEVFKFMCANYNSSNNSNYNYNKEYNLSFHINHKTYAILLYCSSARTPRKDKLYSLL